MTAEFKKWMAQSIAQFMDEFVENERILTGKSRKIVERMEYLMAKSLELSGDGEEKYDMAEELLQVFYSLNLRDEVNPPAVLYEIVSNNREQYGEEGKRRILRSVCRHIAGRGESVPEWIRSAYYKGMPGYKSRFLSDLRDACKNSNFRKGKNSRTRKKILYAVCAACLMAIMFLCGCMFEYQRRAPVQKEVEQEAIDAVCETFLKESVPAVTFHAA